MGLGAVAREVHLPLLRGLDGVVIAALADTDGDALERAGQGFGHSVVRSNDPLAACRGEAAAIDAVLIASPTRFHAEQAAAALRAGLHVYLEKPVAARLDEARSLAEIAFETEQVVQLGFNYRFDPAYSEMARCIEQGAVGRVRRVEMAFRAPLDPAKTWREDEEGGGGVLLDLFSHDVDLLGFMGFCFDEVAAERHGDAVRVTATLRLHEPGHVPETVSFEGDYGYRSADVAHCRLTAERGVLSYDRYRDLAPRRRPSNRSALTVGLLDLAGQIGSLGTVLDRRRSPWRQPTYRLALQAFLDAVLRRPGSGAVAGATLAEGLESLRVVDAARRSLEEDARPVALARPGTPDR